MKNSTLKRTVFMAVFTLLLAAMAQAVGQAPRRGLNGDWKVTTQFGDRDFNSILNFSRGEDGLTGSWITFWGMTELKDVNFEDNQLTYTQSFRGRDGETTSKFKGTVENGKLTGTLSGDRGESKVAGERMPRGSRAAGKWAMTIKAGEREYTGTLVLKSDEEGNLTGDWISQRGENAVRNVAYNRGELSFARTIKIQDNEWESKFTGNIRGNNLTGVFTSDRGEAETTGERIGGEAIGTWILDLESERGPRQQRLRILPDMSALYGSAEIEEVQFANNQLSFKNTMSFGDREFESNFQGKIDGDTLTGEVTTGQGARKVTGKKQTRNFRRGQ